MVVGTLPNQLLQDCFGLLTVIFMIYVVDSIPGMISRRKKDPPVKLPQVQPRGMKPIIVWVEEK